MADGDEGSIEVPQEQEPQSEETQQPQSNKKSGLGYKIGCGLQVVAVLIAVILSMSVLGALVGIGTSILGGKDGSSGSLNCSGVANVPAQYSEWVRMAAAKYLKGDTALLIALIQTESGWNPNAKNISATTHAVGLGQFQPGSARGWKEFTGGCDKGKNINTAAACTAGGGKWWGPAYVYNGDPPASDARFDPERAIFAAAHYLSTTGDLHGGDYFLGYEKNYHGGSYGPTARKKLEENYDKVRKGCNDSTTNIAGGKGCPAIAENALIQVSRLQRGWHDLWNNMPGEKYCSNPYQACGRYWCTDLVIDAYTMAGFKITTTKSAALMASWFRDNAIYFANGTGTPKPGDFIDFYQDGGSGHHVGVVTSIEGDCFKSAESNTLNKEKTYCLKGGQYTRSGNRIFGFARLKECTKE